MCRLEKIEASTIHWIYGVSHHASNVWMKSTKKVDKYYICEGEIAVKLWTCDVNWLLWEPVPCATVDRGYSWERNIKEETVRLDLGMLSWTNEMTKKLRCLEKEIIISCACSMLAWVWWDPMYIIIQCLLWHGFFSWISFPIPFYSKSCRSFCLCHLHHWDYHAAFKIINSSRVSVSWKRKRRLNYEDVWQCRFLLKICMGTYI